MTFFKRFCLLALLVLPQMPSAWASSEAGATQPAPSILSQNSFAILDPDGEAEFAQEQQENASLTQDASTSTEDLDAAPHAGFGEKLRQSSNMVAAGAACVLAMSGYLLHKVLNKYRRNRPQPLVTLDESSCDQDGVCVVPL